MSDPKESRTRREGTHLLVRAGEYTCGLPLAAVRRVVRALAVHPLPGAAGELEGLAEFGGEPLPVLNLARLVNASPGANPSYPVTIVVRVGPAGAGGQEMLGLTADAALEVVHVPPDSIVAGEGGFLQGEAPVGGEVVRILNLEALGS
jgi:purine-binding chemotaxis protein CheW